MTLPYNKIHILDGPSGAFSQLGERKVCFYRSLKALSKLGRIERSIRFRFSRESIVRYYDNSFSECISDNDTVIVFDSMTHDFVIDEIDTKHGGCRKIFFFWNPCRDFAIIEDLRKRSWEIWTFDPEDARRFGIRYAGQFMPRAINLDAKQTIESDVFFVGIDKGRFEILNEISAQLANSLRLNFKMVSPLKALFNRKYSARIPYSKCIEEALKSKSILDLTQKGQAGLTLRVLEAFFLNKKIITNNNHIQNYSFFNSDNIFYLNDSDLSLLPNFISKEVGSSSAITGEYTYPRWLERIITGKEMNDYSFKV